MRYAVLTATICVLALTTALPWAMAQEITDSELADLLGEESTAASSPGAGAAGVGGFSNRSNPAISLVGLILGTGSEKTSSDFGLQEFELRFSSVIDPNFRADVTLALEQEIGGNDEEEVAGAESEPEPAIEIEQAEISTIGLPQVTIRFGKFWLPFGKHNTLHAHQFPFVDAPAVIAGTFGEEALNEVAIDAAPLLPLPFFSELNLVAFEGANEELFQFDDTGSDPDKARYLVHSKNQFDLGEDDTLELGLSYLSGTNNAGDNAVTTASGVDLTYKHRPSFGRGRSGFVLQSEWIGTNREAETGLKSSGYYVSAQWRVLEFWWVQVRNGAFTADTADAGAVAEEETVHTDVLIAWVPTEFSTIRGQYSIIEQNDQEVASWFLQYNFVIGAHPAHGY